MLSEYGTAMLARHKAAKVAPAPDWPLEPNRIGIALVALSVLSALALLYSAWFASTSGPRTARALPVSTIASPIIHPATSGLPESAIFMRHPPRESGDLTDLAVLQTGTSAR